MIPLWTNTISKGGILFLRVGFIQVFGKGGVWGEADLEVSLIMTRVRCGAVAKILLYENKSCKREKEKSKTYFQRLKTMCEKVRRRFKASESVYLWFVIHKFTYKLKVALGWGDRHSLWWSPGVLQSGRNLGTAISVAPPPFVQVVLGPTTTIHHPRPA